MIDRERRRSLWFRAHRRLGLRIRVPVDGFRLLLDPHDELAGQLIFADYEHAERELVRRALRPGDVFADVGAHVGLFSVLASRVVGSTGRVYAFEPSSRTFDALCMNLRRNRAGRIVVPRRVALSDSDGEQAIQIGDERFSAWTSFGRVPPGTPAGLETVETRTIDSLLREGLLERPFLLKLDVEGWELHVLHGGSQSLARDDAPHLLVEFTDLAAEAAGSSTAALYEALVELGYALFRYVAGDLVEEPRRDEYPYDNLVATKRPEELRERIRASA